MLGGIQMNLEQFEKKVAEFALEQGWIPKKTKEDGEYNHSGIRIESQYKEKNICFYTTCTNINFSVFVESTNISDMLETTLRMIKAYPVKTRTKKEEKEEA